MLDGNLGVKCITKRKYISKSRFDVTDKYYRLPNGWKVKSTQRLIVANKYPIVGTLWGSLISFVANLFSQEKTINKETVLRYLKYYYYGKKVVSYHDVNNAYGLKYADYSPLNSLEEVQNIDLPKKTEVLYNEETNTYTINDNENYVHIVCYH